MPRIVPIPWQKFEKFLLLSDCVFVRQKGDHRIYSKPGLARPIIVPMYRALPVFIIKSNLRTLGTDVQHYQEIIEKI